MYLENRYIGKYENLSTILWYLFTDDFQQTIRSNKSEGTTEAVSLANVSDPNSGTGSSNNANRTGGSSSIHHSQHNYSNVQHPHSHCDPAPKTTNTSNGGSLTSSRTQSSNASPANAMLGTKKFLWKTCNSITQLFRNKRFVLFLHLMNILVYFDIDQGIQKGKCENEKALDVCFLIFLNSTNQL